MGVDMVNLIVNRDSEVVRTTWHAKLDADLLSGALSETQEVIDYRNALDAIDTSLARDDIDWPDYPNA